MIIYTPSGGSASVNDTLPGLYATEAKATSGSTITLTAGRAYFSRFVPKRNYSITLAAFGLAVAAGANDNVDIGVFDANLTTLVASSGSTAGKLNTTLGTVTVPLTVSLTAGTCYYVAFSAITPFGGTAAQVRGINFATTDVPYLFASAAPKMEAAYASQFPLANTPSLSTGISAVPLIALRES